MGSPYPWHYTLRWPYYFFRPSIKRHVELEPRPPSYSFELVKNEDTIRLMFFGDMMPVRGDLVIGNCEAPITYKTKACGSVFQISTDFVRVFLMELGVSPERCVLSVANNHIGDQGQEGLGITLEHLMSIGITPIGHRNSNQRPIKRIICNRLRLGIAQSKYLSSHFGSMAGK